MTSELLSATPCLTGVGILLESNLLLAPLDSELSYRDTDLLDQIKLCVAYIPIWGYGFHNSCWKLLLARVPYIDMLDLVQSLFNLFYFLRCPYSASFDFGHDYEGAATTHRLLDCRTVIDTSSYFYADPCAIPSLTELQNLAPAVYASASSKQTAVLNSAAHCRSHHDDLLANLPVDLVYLVLSYLPFNEVANIRLVCRDWAQIAKPENLPQSFWQRTFIIGGGKDYIFSEATAVQDWFQLFFGVKSCLASRHALLTNRKRI